MIAAIYARKSNEQNGAGDETKSVARQVEHARAYAERKGWTVGDEYVFVDDGVSGAEFEGRPGFVRLMNALRPRPPFGALVMSEESRLGREMIATAYALKQIVTAGVRVFYYLEDRERTLDSPTDKVLMAVNGYAAELEREMARQRSRDASRQRAQHGFVAGGACFGYRNVRVDGHVMREIDPTEADIVRRIFEMARDGKGARRIAAALNAERAPCPRAQQGRPDGWVASSIKAVLARELYAGRQVWGKSRKRDTWGRVRFAKRPESEWLCVDVPHLRIVSDELWEATHERLAASRDVYLRGTGGQLWGKPASGVESKYLLTGLTRCGCCGAGLVIYSRSHGRQRAFFYGCPRARVDLCENDLDVRMEQADEAALSMIADEVLAPAVIALALDKLFAMLDAPTETPAARRTRLAEALAQVDAELANLARAVAAEPSDTLLAAIREREREAKRLRADIAAVDAAPAVRAGADAVRAEALRLVEDWRGLLRRNTATGRQLLRKVLDRERFLFTPQRAGSERWYDVAVRPSLDRFLAAVPSLNKAVASPKGSATGYQVRGPLPLAA